MLRRQAAAFLLKLNSENAKALDDVPDFVVQGAMVYQTRACAACHRVNVTGMEVGPSLNGPSKRRARSWVEQHFADAPELWPGSIMPV